MTVPLLSGNKPDWTVTFMLAGYPPNQSALRVRVISLVSDSQNGFFTHQTRALPYKGYEILVFRIEIPGQCSYKLLLSSQGFKMYINST